MTTISTADHRIIAEMKPAYRADRTTEAIRLLEVFTADVSQFDPPTDLEGIIVTVRDLLDALGDVLDTIELTGDYRTTREENMVDSERELASDHAETQGYDRGQEDAVDALTDALFDRGQDARYDALTGMSAPLADADYLRNLSEILAAAVTA